MLTTGSRSFGLLFVKLANEQRRPATRRSTRRIPRCPAFGEDSPLCPLQSTTFHIMPGSRLPLSRSSTCLVTSLRAWMPWRTGKKRKLHWQLRIPTMIDMDRTGFEIDWNASWNISYFRSLFQVDHVKKKVSIVYNPNVFISMITLIRMSSQY